MSPDAPAAGAPTESVDVIVAGGGIAGLVAALECARVGLSVLVLEAADEVGGLVRGHTVGDVELDRGAESIATRGGVVAEYLTRIGLSDQVVAPAPRGSWLAFPDDQGALDVAPSPALGMLGIPASPLAADVRRVIGWRGAWRAYLDRIRPVLKVGSERHLDHLVRSRMGERVLRRLVTPVVAGVYSSGAADVDVDLIAPGLNRALTTAGSLSGGVAALRQAAPPGSRVAGIRGGVHRLPRAIADQLDLYGSAVRTGMHVTGLRRRAADGEWLVDVRPAARDSEAGAAELGDAEADAAESDDATTDLPVGPITLGARGLIVALPAEEALALLHPLVGDATQADWPRGPRIELVTLVVDAPLLDAAPRGSGILVAPDTDGVAAKALTHATAKWPWLAESLPAGRHVLRLSYGRDAGTPVTADLDEKSAVRLALGDAALLLGVPRDALRLVAGARVALHAPPPATHLGHRERVQALTDALDAEHGPTVVGAWLAGAGLASVIPHAVAQAQLLRRALIGANAVL